MKESKGIDNIQVRARIMERMEIRFTESGKEYVAKLTNRKCIGIYLVYEEFPEVERWLKLDTVAICNMTGVSTINELINKTEELTYTDTKNKTYIGAIFADGQIGRREKVS